MRRIIEVFNQLVAEGAIQNYAVGGAVGATFYVRAITTDDVDVFVPMAVSAAGQVSIGPIYEALVRHGGQIEGENVTLAGYPVQVLPDADDLIREAIVQARRVEVQGVTARVFTAEHMCAIAARTGRAKDKARIGIFVSERAVDVALLRDILRRHGLEQAFLELFDGRSEPGWNDSGRGR